MTARDRPVIYADDPRFWFALALRYSAQFSQHGVSTGAQAQGVGKPGCCLTTEGVAQRVQRPSLRSRTTLIPIGQGVDVLGKRTTRAVGVHTLEATYLNSENDPLLEHWTFFQLAHIATVESMTPTMAARTKCPANCAAGFDNNGLPLHFAGDDVLTHTGENTIDPTENLPHGKDQRRPTWPEIKALTRPSHNVRETRDYYTSRLGRCQRSESCLAAGSAMTRGGGLRSRSHFKCGQHCFDKLADFGRYVLAGRVGQPQAHLRKGRCVQYLNETALPEVVSYHEIRQ